VPKFRKKPVLIEAVQFTGDNLDEVAHFIGTALAFEGYRDGRADAVRLTTIDGDTIYAWASDWIIPEPAPDRFYRCNKEIFAASYEPADESTKG
jgi:hypothetical protein